MTSHGQLYTPDYNELQKYVQIDGQILDDLIANVEYINDASNNIRNFLEQRNWDQLISDVKTLTENVKIVHARQDQTLAAMSNIAARSDKIDRNTRQTEEFIAEATALKEWWAEAFKEFQQIIITQAVFKTGEL